MAVADLILPARARRLSTVKRRRVIRIVASLAVLLNLGGYSAAWAHGQASSIPAETRAMPADCHTHATAPAEDESVPDSGAPSCCTDGDCHCAAAPALAAVPASLEWRLPDRSDEPTFVAPPLPSAPPDRELRPPIA